MDFNSNTDLYRPPTPTLNTIGSPQNQQPYSKTPSIQNISSHQMIKGYGAISQIHNKQQLNSDNPLKKSVSNGNINSITNILRNNHINYQKDIYINLQQLLKTKRQLELLKQLRKIIQTKSNNQLILKIITNLFHIAQKRLQQSLQQYQKIKKQFKQLKKHQRTIQRKLEQQIYQHKQTSLSLEHLLKQNIKIKQQNQQNIKQNQLNVRESKDQLSIIVMSFQNLKQQHSLTKIQLQSLNEKYRIIEQKLQRQIYKHQHTQQMLSKYKQHKTVMNQLEKQIQQHNKTKQKLQIYQNNQNKATQQSIQSIPIIAINQQNEQSRATIKNLQQNLSYLAEQYETLKSDHIQLDLQYCKLTQKYEQLLLINQQLQSHNYKLEQLPSQFQSLLDKYSKDKSISQQQQQKQIQWNSNIKQINERYDMLLIQYEQYRKNKQEQVQQVIRNHQEEKIQRNVQIEEQLKGKQNQIVIEYEGYIIKVKQQYQRRGREYQQHINNLQKQIKQLQYQYQEVLKSNENIIIQKKALEEEYGRNMMLNVELDSVYYKKCQQYSQFHDRFKELQLQHNQQIQSIKAVSAQWVSQLRKQLQKSDRMNFQLRRKIILLESNQNMESTMEDDQSITNHKNSIR